MKNNVMKNISICKLILACLFILSIIIITNAPITAQNNADEGISANTLTDSVSNEPGMLFKVDPSYSSASVSTVKGSTLQRIPASNMSNTLFGYLPGLTDIQGSGQPGYDGSTLRIRGVGTYNVQDIAVYVDGFETNYSYFQYMMPGEIESVSIFKDAASLTPFGMKGSNGVLWVVTKRGQAGKPHVQVQARTGFQNPITINKPLDSYGYATLYNEAISNDNGMIWSPVYSDTQLSAYKNGTGTNVDWYDEVLRSNAPYTDANASFSGGDPNNRYFVYLGYLNNQGLYDVVNDDTHSNSNHSRINIRTNLDFSLFDIFEGKVNLGGRLEDRGNPNYSSNELWNNLSRYPANIYPVMNENGSWTGTSIFPDNPVASITDLGYVKTHDRTLQANFTLKENLGTLLDGLYINEGISFNNWTRGTYYKTKNYARFIGDVQQTTDQNTNFDVYDDSGTNQWNWIQATATVGYDNKFGLHEIKSAVNYLQYSYNDDANQNGLAGVHTDYGYKNIGGRIHYVYNDRYVGELGFSFSGSDNFMKGNRWGFYPALSAAWIISNESFLSESKVIDNLKLRASAGITGNDRFAGRRYLYQGYYIESGGYYTGTGEPIWNNGIIRPYVPNPEIFAEKSTKYNIGIDGNLLGSLQVSLDAFLNKNSDIITQDNALSAVFGAAPPYRNIGEVTSKGFEASINYSKNTGRFNYFIGALATYNKNKIDYMAEVITVPTASRTGNPIGTPFGLEATGFYDINDFNSDGTLSSSLPVPEFGAVQPGDLKYNDLNGDGRVNQQDEMNIGNAYLPKLTYSINGGINFMHFDLSLLFQGASGRSINLLDSWNQTVAFVDNGNVYPIAEGRWAYYPDQGIDTRAEATYPRLTTTGNNNNYRNSTFWMVNGNFLRLRNAELGYTLSANFGNSNRPTNIRIFINAVNMFTWSHVTRDYDMDPETLSGYPALKSFTGGFTVDF